MGCTRSTAVRTSTEGVLYGKGKEQSTAAHYSSSVRVRQVTDQDEKSSKLPLTWCAARAAPPRQAQPTR